MFLQHADNNTVCELLALVEQAEARLMGPDTEVMPAVYEMAVAPTDDPWIVYRNPYIVQLLLDAVDNEQMAWSDATTRGGSTFLGRPSRAAIEFLARHSGFRCNRFDCSAYFAQHDYARISMVDEVWRDTSTYPDEDPS